MGMIEAIKHLFSQHKWYAGVYYHQKAYRLKRSFEEGTMKIATARRILTDFGYKEEQQNWSK